MCAIGVSAVSACVVVRCGTSGVFVCMCVCMCVHPSCGLESLFDALFIKVFEVRVYIHFSIFLWVSWFNRYCAMLGMPIRYACFYTVFCTLETHLTLFCLIFVSYFCSRVMISVNLSPVFLYMKMHTKCSLLQVLAQYWCIR